MLKYALFVSALSGCGLWLTVVVGVMVLALLIVAVVAAWNQPARAALVVILICLARRSSWPGGKEPTLLSPLLRQLSG